MKFNGTETQNNPGLNGPQKPSGPDFCWRKSLEEMTFPLQMSQDVYIDYRLSRFAVTWQAPE